MRLSEAMRLGATLKPQNFGDLYGKKISISRTNHFPWFRLDVVSTSCAIGAAYEAAGYGWKEQDVTPGTVITPFRGKVSKTKAKTISYWDVPREIYALLWTEVVCPECKQKDSLQRIVPHLNDDHKWSRERIADFVELHEPLPFAIEELEARTATESSAGFLE